MSRLFIAELIEPYCGTVEKSLIQISSCKDELIEWCKDNYPDVNIEFTETTKRSIYIREWHNQQGNR